MFRHKIWIYEIVKELIDGILSPFLIVFSMSEIEKGSQKTKVTTYKSQKRPMLS